MIRVGYTPISMNTRIGIHALAGILFAFFPALTFFWQIGVLLLGMFDIISSRDSGGEAAWWAAYLAGMEVLLRMTGQYIFWEIAKYGVVLLLSTGLMVNARAVRSTYFIYFLLLLPSLLIANYADWGQARDMISFNLSGPLCLAVSGIYFYKSKLTGRYLLELIRVFILPMICMITYLTIQTPDLTSIIYDTGSNFVASGGFGPNQVSLIFGFAIFFMVVLRFYGTSFSGHHWLDYLIIGIFLFRALITFSRGGVLGAAVAIGVLLILDFAKGNQFRRFSNYIFFLLFVGSISIFIWSYTNNLTEDVLSSRYQGLNEQGKPKADVTSGRLLVMERDWVSFKENPVLGVGPGLNKGRGKEQHIEGIAAHSEWSRMLAEHGSFGFLALLILFFAPLIHAVYQPAFVKPLLLSILVLALFSMLHSAMRLASISLIYSWALIIPFQKKPFKLKRK